MADSTSTTSSGLPNALIASILQGMFMPRTQQNLDAVDTPDTPNQGAGYGSAGRNIQPDPNSTIGSPPGFPMANGGGASGLGGYYFTDLGYLAGPNGAIAKDGSVVTDFSGAHSEQDLISKKNLITPADVEASLKTFVNKLMDQVNQPATTDPLNATPATNPLPPAPPATPAPARQPTQYAQLPSLPPINTQTLGASAAMAQNNPNLTASAAPSAGNRTDINVPSYQPAQVPQPPQPPTLGGTAAIAPPVQSVVPPVNPAQRQYVYQNPIGTVANVPNLSFGASAPIINSIGASGTPWAGSPISTGANNTLVAAPTVGPAAPGANPSVASYQMATPGTSASGGPSVNAAGYTNAQIGSAIGSGISNAGNAIAQGFAHPAQLNVGALQPPPLLAPYQAQVPYRIA